jgi:formate hydrogenlyase subunit 6/NADH:ubiquinone oxidoreductase subunit I
MEEIYSRLARHLQDLVMGYPFSEHLLRLLEAVYTPEEASILLGLPNDLVPLEVVGANEIAQKARRPLSRVESVLNRLAERGLIYSAPMPSGGRGYALLHVGYGMPQTFFWSGRMDERARRMAKLVYDYFGTGVTKEIYGDRPTKTYRYIPVGINVAMPFQGVMPFDGMGRLVEAATEIAVAHCPCRVSARASGRTDCQHSLEVCIKYDEMADFIVTQGLGRSVSKDEAMFILKKCEQEGLVHMVDNAQGQIKHTCNCCGHYCWNVGLIKRRKVARDTLMAVYFLRETAMDECIGCGACADICPVRAVDMIEDRPMVHIDWCLGCGVCAPVCPAGAITLYRRSEQKPPRDFRELHQFIKSEKSMSGKD